MKAFRDRVIGHRPNDWQAFHELIAQHLQPGIRALDVGCGRGDVAPFPWHAFPTVELIGIDTDPVAASNPFLRRFLPLRAGAPWPIERESIDLVLCRYVLEHVEDPRQFFDNVQRTLKPGGLFLFLTPNLWHPVAVLSRVLPAAAKRRVLRWAKGIQEGQVFPTRYRANSPSRLARLAKQHGLEAQTLLTKEFAPSGYLDFSVLGYFCAWTYFTLVKRTGWEKYFGAQIIGVFEKPAGAPRPGSESVSQELAARLLASASGPPSRSFAQHSGGSESRLGPASHGLAPQVIRCLGLLWRKLPQPAASRIVSTPARRVKVNAGGDARATKTPQSWN